VCQGFVLLFVADRPGLGPVMPMVDELAIRERVSFDLALKNLAGNYSSFTTISFKGNALGRHKDWIGELCSTLAQNTTCEELDLSETELTDEALQRLIVAFCSASCAAQLRVLNVRGNPFSLAGETMVQGLRRLRPALDVRLDGADGPAVDGFVHSKTLVEGLSAWPADALSIAGGSDLRCPQQIVGTDEVVVLTKGFQGSNGTKYTCEHAVFELAHGTGNLVLKQLEPEAKLRLSGCISKGAPRQEGVLV